MLKKGMFFLKIRWPLFFLVLSVFLLFIFWDCAVLFCQNLDKSGTDDLELRMAGGADLYKQGRFDLAKQIYQDCLDLARKMRAVRPELECLMKVGLIHWNDGHINPSFHLYKEALSLAQEYRFEDIVRDCRVILEIFSLYTEGKQLRISSRHQESIQSFLQAIRKAQTLGSVEFELKCWRQLSLTYWALFRLQDFRDSCQRALELSRKMSHRREEGKNLINMGLYCQKIENYSKALILYRDALHIARNQGNKPDESACLNNMGILYQRIGNYRLSIRHHSTR